MILTADIGNTNIGMGLFKGKRLIKRIAIPTRKDSYTKGLIKFALSARKKIEKVVVVSVVPEATPKFIKSAKKVLTAAKIYVIGKDIKVPLKSRYNKKEIGQDRLVTAFAAGALYGTPSIVVDFGTAVTFDVVSAKAEYLGGLIMPGIKMSLDSLYRKTALLPKVVLKRPKTVIGLDTNSSIINGMIYGYASVCDGIVSRLKNAVARRHLAVVATGGDAGLIAKYAKSISIVDRDLSIKGLLMLLYT